MASPEDHSLSSARTFGGVWSDYFLVHDFFDITKVWLSDFRHRACRHHDVGIDMAVSMFGRTLTNSAGNQVPVRLIGEQHMYEDFGHVPTFDDWWQGAVAPEDIRYNADVTALLLAHVTPQKWMCAGAHKLSQREHSPA